MYIIADEEGSAWHWARSSLCLGLLNLFILIGCLIKIFVYGDPVLASKSKASVMFWRHRKQADFEITKVSLYKEKLIFRVISRSLFSFISLSYICCKSLGDTLIKKIKS